MGGGKKTSSKSKSVYKPAEFIQSGARQAASLASDYANQAYTPYTGQRVAGLSENQQLGIDLAKNSVGQFQGDVDSARSALDGIQDFSQFDAETYMNPYIESALNPAARELREEGLRRRNAQAGKMSSQGAFSGSRAALAMREEDEMTNQGLSDLYDRGYSQAFDRGTALWSGDQDRALQKSQGYLSVAGMGSDLVNQDFNRLMESGDTQRFVDQSMKDFDYQQFIEERDWGGKQAAYLTDVLRGLKGSYEETTTSRSSSKESGSAMGQVLGAATTVAAAYFTGGAGLAATPASSGDGAAKASQGGGGGGWSDRRLKSNIERIGHLKHNGLPVYSFTIFGNHEIGVMAQEVLGVMPEAVIYRDNGYMAVDYDMIGWDAFSIVYDEKEAA